MLEEKVPSFLLTDDPLERLNKAMALFSETELEKQDTSSISGNDADADNAYIRPIYDEETMAETIEQTTSLLVNNADLKAQIQEKVFAIAALKNDLRKLKGNSVDTKF
ncbi:hypothetical protein Tco_0996026, partial [Tanacetum coccineum]